MAPLTIEASSLARNRQQAAISSAIAGRRAGTWAVASRYAALREMPRSTASSSIDPSPSGVTTQPGHTAFVRTPWGP